jgi:eukaryotic-like serine/threonine-protein kinase
MGRFARLLLLSLILLFVAMLSAVTAMRFAIHGREVTVPKVVGMSKDQARKAAEDLGLIFDSEEKFYSSEVAAGKIATQYPVPGSRVRRGWRLRAAESLGPQRAEIPDLVGQSTRAAEINVRRRGLELASVATARIPGVEPGTIVGQSPPAKSSGLVSPKVSVLLAAPGSEMEFVMPNFIGKSLAEVVAQLELAGLKLAGMGDRPSSFENRAKKATAHTGMIVKQDPAPGMKVISGANVSFEVAAAAPVATPAPAATPQTSPAK